MPPKPGNLGFRFTALTCWEGHSIVCTFVSFSRCLGHRGYLISILFSVICLQKCYICSSEVSWEDCNSYSKTKEAVCPLRSPNCVKGELTCTSGEEKKTVFYKRCGAPEKTCNITAEDRPSCPYSESGWSSHFDNNCCDGNFCNSGSSQKISRAGIGVVMVVALWPLTDMYWLYV